MDESVHRAEESEVVAPGGIGGIGLLDLTSVRSLDDLTGMGRIGGVGVALVPESLLVDFTRLSIEGIGSVVPIPISDRGEVRIRNGLIELDAEALATGTGNPEDSLVVVGSCVITGAVEAVAYRRLIVVGQLVAPAACRRVVEAAVAALVGQALYYREPCRLILTDTRLGRAFLELLDGPTRFVVAGTLRLKADVDADLVRAKVAALEVAGEVVAPAQLVPLLQMLAPSNPGAIAADEPAGDAA